MLDLIVVFLFYIPDRVYLFICMYVQVNNALMNKANKGAVFLHCLPRHEEEVSDEVRRGQNFIPPCLPACLLACFPTFLACHVNPRVCLLACLLFCKLAYLLA